MKKFIAVNEPLLNGNEKKYLKQCIDTGWISSEGEFVTRFENEMASYVGRNYGISVTNATAALEVAIDALDFAVGDEIIMPAFTIISCILPMIKRGIVPVLVDADINSWNMDIDQIETKITDKTKAIMVVHIYGMPCEMDKILELSRKYNLKIIEDAAEVHGQEYKGKKCGSFGDISIFSFYANKIITTGEGGMIVTDDPELAARCKSIRNLCFKPEQRFVHDELGFNYRMTNIQAALGVAQLEKIDDHIKRKREIGKKYNKLLKNESKINLPMENADYSENIYWVYGVTLKKEIKVSASKVMEMLKERGIGTRPFFYPMHKQPVLNKMGLFLNQEYPVSEYLYEKGFYLPSGLGITDAQIRMSAEALIEVLKEIE